MDEIKRYRLLIGGVVLLAMVGVTWWAINTQTGETPAAASELPSLPEIDREALTQIEIRRPGEEDSIRLVREGSTWRLAAPLEDAAARTTVDTALDKLADLEVTRVAAAKAATHARLQVDSENGVRVTARAGEQTVIDFWIGAASSGATYVRLEGQDQVLEVRGLIKFAFNKAPHEWRDRAIVDLEIADLREATFTNTNGAFQFRRSGENWEPVLPAPAEGEEPPAGIERFSASRTRTAITGLARLRASEFAAPDTTVESAGLGEGAARVALVSGEGENAQTLTLLVGNELDEGKRYVMREGNSTIYVVSRFHADRLVPNTATFQEPEPNAEGAEGGEGGAPAGGEAPAGMPPMPGAGGQLPPELMRQIQQQLQQQGLGGGAPPEDSEGHEGHEGH